MAQEQKASPRKDVEVDLSAFRTDQIVRLLGYRLFYRTGRYADDDPYSGGNTSQKPATS
jgi:hypothetical protein